MTPWTLTAIMFRIHNLEIHVPYDFNLEGENWWVASSVRYNVSHLGLCLKFEYWSWCNEETGKKEIPFVRTETKSPNLLAPSYQRGLNGKELWLRFWSGRTQTWFEWIRLSWLKFPCLSEANWTRFQFLIGLLTFGYIFSILNFLTSHSNLIETVSPAIKTKKEILKKKSLKQNSLHQ